MNFRRFVRLFTTEPVKLTLKAKLISVVFCFSAILIVGAITAVVSGGLTNPILVASMGASAVILFIIPNSPLAQPWAFVGGQMISALVGIACAQLIPDVLTAASVAAGGSVLMMLLLRCLHPPAAATALTPVLGGYPLIKFGYSYALIPVGVNVLVMLALAILINRYLMRYDYPALTKTEEKKSSSTTQQTAEITVEDMKQALEKNAIFVDVTTTELSHILNSAELQRFKRLSKTISCADIMDKNVITVEYGTDVEQAWRLMLQHNQKAVPVLDKARRIIGILTWHDFFKALRSNSSKKLTEQLLCFVKRTADINTDKPESVGHIMTPQVTVCLDSYHIADLIPLMINSGYRQLPVINHERRFVGLVYQENLIGALYQQHLTDNEN